MKSRMLAGGALALALVLAPTAHADSIQEQCVSGYEQSQRLSLDGKLRGARAQLLLCSRPTCPKITLSDCSKWLAALEPKVPTVLISARDASGKDIESLRVLVDGEVLVERLDGRPIDVDPGPHTFRYESGKQAIEERVVVIEGEKNRRLAVDFAKAPAPTTGSVATVVPTTATTGPTTPPAAEPTSAGIPTASWVLGGVSIVSVAMFAGFAFAGKQAEGCVPNCSQERVDDFRRDYLIADVSLVIALASGGIALYLALTNNSPRAPTTTTAR